MSDEIFRQTRKKIEPEAFQNFPNPMDSVNFAQNAMAQETGNTPPNMGMSPNFMPEIKGAIPPEIREMMGQNPAFAAQPQQTSLPPQRQKLTPDASVRHFQQAESSAELQLILQKLAGEHTWEEIELPSRGKFYQNIPGKIHVRAMTGQEEQILATSRFVKKGQAIDMIFQKCIQEPIDTTQLLSVDRNYILIFLRGISYTTAYDVEIKCPACGINFSTVIDLDAIQVESCPNDFGPESLSGILPKSKLSFSYRLSKGGDEQNVTNYREKRIQTFGDQGNDDTALYRTALLIESIENITELNEIKIILGKLPVNDVVYLRNLINEPPFGVNTDIEMLCPGCGEEFKVGLPLEASFFFPRKKETKTQA